MALVLAGCGGDDKSTSSAKSSTNDTPRERTIDRPQPAIDEAPRSRRDAEVERNLKRDLKQEAAFASGWTFADIRAVRTRARQVVVKTRLTPGEREAASSLCSAVRRSSQNQDPSSVIVSGRDGAALVEC